MISTVKGKTKISRYFRNAGYEKAVTVDAAAVNWERGNQSMGEG